MKMKLAAEKYGVAYGTIKKWNQTKKSILEFAETSGRLDDKARYDSPLWRVERAVTEFYEINKLADDQLPFTGSVISQLAINAKAKLLQEDAQKRMLCGKQTLCDREKNAIEACTFSDSWAKKFAKKLNSRSSDATRIAHQLNRATKECSPGNSEATSTNEPIEPNIAAGEVSTVRFYEELKCKQLSSITKWLTQEVIGFGANVVEMQGYAKHFFEYGFHSVELIQEICTPDDVEAFAWMKTIHKRLFLTRAQLKSCKSV
jgi:hypothetical protein